MKIWNYWSESNSWIYFYIVLKKKQKFNGSKFYWSWAGGPVLIVRTAFRNRTKCKLLLCFSFLSRGQRNRFLYFLTLYIPVHVYCIYTGMSCTNIAHFLNFSIVCLRVWSFYYCLLYIRHKSVGLQETLHVP